MDTESVVTEVVPTETPPTTPVVALVETPPSKPKHRRSKPRRHRLPNTREGLNHKFDVNGHEGYIRTSVYDDGQLGEIFLVMTKKGSTLSGVMNSFAIAVSIALQYGTPLAALAKAFINLRFEPSGFTKNRNIPVAKSLSDYIFRVLASKYCTPKELEKLGLVKTPDGSCPPSQERGLLDCPVWGSLVRHGDMCETCPQRTLECGG